MTNDLDRRFEEHTSQRDKCAKYLRGKGPFEVVFQESGLSKSAALRREIEIKALSKNQTEALMKLLFRLDKLSRKCAQTTHTILWLSVPKIYRESRERR